MSIPLTISLCAATYICFAPLNAFIDHLADFHLDHGFLESEQTIEDKAFERYSDMLAERNDRAGSESDRDVGTSGPPDRDP